VVGRCLVYGSEVAHTALWVHHRRLNPVSYRSLPGGIESPQPQGDSIDNSKRPTKAAIEAALSAYYGEVDEAARKDALPEHQRVFDEIVMDSEDLQGVIIGVSTALTIGPFEDAPTENLLKKAQDLVAAGQLDEDLL
jgi:hypothetical protein